MAKFEHKDSVEVVDAHMLQGDNVTVISSWCRGLIVEEIDPFDNESRYPALNVQCRGGVKRASLGDYVIKHEDGSFDIRKTTDFLRHYQAA
jgi:hypothetical protein